MGRYRRIILRCPECAVLLDLLICHAEAMAKVAGERHPDSSLNSE